MTTGIRGGLLTPADGRGIWDSGEGSQADGRQMTPLTLGVFLSCFFYGMFVVRGCLPLSA
jgi:hypothetical protein